MPQCPKCNNVIPSNNHFCSYCGSTLQGNTVLINSNPQPVSKGTGVLKIIAVLLLLVVIGLAGLVIFIVTSNNSNSTPTVVVYKTVASETSPASGTTLARTAQVASNATTAYTTERATTEAAALTTLETKTYPSVTNLPTTSMPVNTILVYNGALSEIVRGRTGKKQVALTFDASSTADSFNLVLDTLNNKGVKVTFFLTGT